MDYYFIGIIIESGLNCLPTKKHFFSCRKLWGSHISSLVTFKWLKILQQWSKCIISLYKIGYQNIVLKLLIPYLCESKLHFFFSFKRKNVNTFFPNVNALITLPFKQSSFLKPNS